MLLVVAAGIAGALRVEVDEERIRNFNPSDPIRIAHRTIATRFDGASHLDVLVETPREDGLLQRDHLRKTQDLQRFLETLPGVSATLAMPDFLARIDDVIDDRRGSRVAIDEDTAAQYLLLYTASGRPTALDDIVDAGHRVGLVRATLASGRYSNHKTVIEAADRYLKERFNAPGITGTTAGRPVVDYHWMEPLRGGIWRGVALALMLAWLTIAIALGSATAATMAVVPVGMAVLLTYAAMGFGGIWLGVGTSMFAAIAIGTAVNPAVHLIDRLTLQMHHRGQPLDGMFARLFATTGRALLFDVGAVLLGFGVLLLSDVPPLVWFGGLIAACVITSFAATVLFLPALVCLLRPGFIGRDNPLASTPVTWEASNVPSDDAMRCGDPAMGPVGRRP
jgi:predicted RND superfamily exporter protein